MVSCSHWGMFDVPCPDGPPSAVNDWARQVMMLEAQLSYDSKYLHGH